jgi:hypothetical protein
MSLTSRVTNLFVSESTTREHCNAFGLTDNGLPGSRDGYANVGLASGLTGSDTMAPETLEEEGRPRYSHVS